MSGARRAAAALSVLAAVAASSDEAAPPDPAPPPAIATPYPLSRDHEPGDTYDGLRLLGTLKLSAVTFRGHLLGGLSALAWDEDDAVLYALSDRGVLFHLGVDFDDDGRLADARLLDAVPLLDARGSALKGARADSEGMVALRADNGVPGDAELAVSFERHPRVMRYSTRGKLLGAVALPSGLRDRDSYRSSNRGLESLAWHPVHGFVTGVEQPFKDVTDGEVQIHALGDGTAGARRRWWRYPLAPEPNAGLVDIATLPDGTLLTLERGYGFFFVPFITTLRRVPSLPGEDGALLEPVTVARLNTGQGWALDNFEGVALLPGGRLLMVSDDNTRAVQATLLAAFELLDAGPQTERRRPPP